METFVTRTELNGETHSYSVTVRAQYDGEASAFPEGRCFSFSAGKVTL